MTYRYRPNTCVRGIITDIKGRIAHLTLEAAPASALGRNFIWVPLSMIDGGSRIKIGSTDPLVSDWWLRERKYTALLSVKKTQQQFSITAQNMEK